MNNCQCGWCKKETPKVYKLPDGDYLCFECATKHYNSVNERMKERIEEIKAELNKKGDKLNKLKEEVCKHENAYNTEYGVGFGENLKEIWRCPDCNKTIYK